MCWEGGVWGGREKNNSPYSHYRQELKVIRLMMNNAATGTAMRVREVGGAQKIKKFWGYFVFLVVVFFS